VIQKRNEGKSGEIIDTIISKYKALEDRFDFVLVEGSDFSGEGSVFEFDENVNIAKNLGLPVIIVASGRGKTKEGLMGSLQMAYQTFINKDVRVMAMVSNKIELANLSIATNGMREFLPDDVAV
ncbi:AAA family ATPase, partial [Salinimicrobium oceani]